MTTERRRQNLGLAVWIAIPIAILSVFIALGDTGPTGSGSDRAGARAHPLAAELSAEKPTSDELAQVLQKAWTGEDLSTVKLSPFWQQDSLGLYLAGRLRGRRLYHVWERHQGSIAEALWVAMKKVRGGKGKRSQELELFIATDRRHHNGNDEAEYAELVAERHRGVRGLEVHWKGKRKSFSPTVMVATNRKYPKQLKVTAGDWKTNFAVLKSEAELFSIGGPQYLASIATDSGEVSVTEMHRGNELVGLGEVTRAATEALADGAADWMWRAVDSSGRFAYKYWPSNGRLSTSNNMIRQWMASHALVKLAKRSDDPKHWDKVSKNIDFNLASWYHEEERDGRVLGLIEFNGKVKLGAVGLAALVISEHPERERWLAQYEALNRTVEYLWHEDGHFDTFLKKLPETRDQPNFYPGEALLMWAERYERSRDAELLKKFMTSFRYYRKWHLRPKHRNPAFVPWHVRAYAKLWNINHDKELSDFVFEMSDWLLSMQQWKPSYPDFLGRFHDPKRRKFGPPHASATGVYLEGYIEAYRLAVQLGETDRAQTYRKAIVGGLRSLMQLQFVDDVDMYYISNRRLVRGGIRTTVYNSEIRCDNIQHGLMGILDILDTFKPEDFRLP